MLSDREREVFDGLVRQFENDETLTPAPAERSRVRAPHEWLLEVAMGSCVVSIAVSGLLGSPEAVLSFTGAMAVLSFIHYA